MTNHFSIKPHCFHGFILSILFSIVVLNQTNAQDEMTYQEDTTYLVGQVSRSELQTGNFGDLFINEYQAYKPNQEILTQLKKYIYDCQIVLVLGTWCHDSQQQVPRFYKLLDELHYNTSAITNICVDKNKNAEGTSVNTLNIERVPTFIFFKDDKEIGRIIETPNTSLEEDTYHILAIK